MSNELPRWTGQEGELCWAVETRKEKTREHVMVVYFTKLVVEQRGAGQPLGSSGGLGSLPSGHEEREGDAWLPTLAPEGLNREGLERACTKREERFLQHQEQIQLIRLEQEQVILERERYIANVSGIPQNKPNWLGDIDVNSDINQPSTSNQASNSATRTSQRTLESFNTRVAAVSHIIPRSDKSEANVEELKMPKGAHINRSTFSGAEYPDRLHCTRLNSLITLPIMRLRSNRWSGPLRLLGMIHDVMTLLLHSPRLEGIWAPCGTGLLTCARDYSTELCRFLQMTYCPFFQHSQYHIRVIGFGSDIRQSGFGEMGVSSAFQSCKTKQVDRQL
uniref:Uncharacterized protein n=1 Tax=Timema genevievae TaxID=629358 RepID=A0A7R9PNP3_TIMGE|nr:unnamed protein product [Timema genevievae]